LLRQRGDSWIGKGRFWTACSQTTVKLVLLVVVVVGLSMSWPSSLATMICHVASDVIWNQTFSRGNKDNDEGSFVSLLVDAARRTTSSESEGFREEHFCQTRAPDGVRPNWYKTPGNASSSLLHRAWPLCMGASWPRRSRVFLR